ncbi:MAG: uroporphyrinogen-III synthase [Myxococcaceae bacterium]
MAPVRRLEGFRVLVTRPRERSRELCFLLEDEGAQVLSVPFLELSPPDDPRPLEAAAEQIHRYAWVLFASPSAAQALVEAVREAGTLERLAKVKVGVVGPATARAAAALGLEVSLVAAVGTGLGLFEAMQGALRPEDEVLLPVAQEGRRELCDELEAAGVRVARVVAYKSSGKSIDEATRSELARFDPNLVIFGSPRTAEAFLEATGEAGKSLLARTRVVAIGPTTAAALTALGLSPAAVAERPTPPSLVEAAVGAIRG